MFRIEFFTEPFEHLFVFFMIWIENNIQKIQISEGASAILRRTIPFPCYACGIFNIFLPGKDFFQEDVMFPVITEIIDINSFFIFGSEIF